MMVDLVLGIVAALSCARSMQTYRQAGSPGSVRAGMHEAESPPRKKSRFFFRVCACSRSPEVRACVFAISVYACSRSHRRKRLCFVGRR